ncbi:MAG TPA: amidohydrolase, partial [Vicinamibacterales bacterium]|nr:amidohydrolase [Vicinamibacterales bacterium]
GTSAEIDRWRGAHTKVIDAGLRGVIPGFDDAHVHLLDGGEALDEVHLKDAPSPQVFARRIGDEAKKIGAGTWVLGRSWDEEAWTPAALPTRQLVDPLTPDNPVFVTRYDGHEGLANSVALKLAGVTAQTPNPPGGEIVRDAKGNPTGVLKDAAMGLVAAVIPPVSPAERMRIVQQALQHAASLGVTSLQDMNPSYATLAVYQQLAEEGQLTARIYVAPIETRWQDQARLGIRHAFGSPFLRYGALKGYADGSLGSRTAYFFRPYADDPGNRGLLTDEMQPLSAIQQRLTAADAAGLQICMHAIGDEAVSMVLDLYQHIEDTNGPRDRRLRIEHAQTVAPADFDRFAKLHVIASVQPYHAIDDGRWAEQRLGPERSKTSYAYKTFLDHKVRLAFGTDWPVAPLDPIQTLYAAVTRATLDGKHPDGWEPAQKLTLADALRAYTAGSAYAEFQDQEKGTIAPGKLADVVVLSADPFQFDISVAPATIRTLKVDMTFVGGKMVYKR